MSMFCYQCQETAKGTGCEIKGVCGKNEEVAKLQDLLIYVSKGISELVVKGKLDVSGIMETNREILTSLFMTITNANFDENAIEKQIIKMIHVRDDLGKKVSLDVCHDSVSFEVGSRVQMLEKASQVGVLATENEDVRSLRELVIYGLKGMAAYCEHAFNLNFEDAGVYAFMQDALVATTDDSLNAEQLTALVLETGKYGVQVMALLDEANTTTYGNPEITKVNIGVRNNPGILISGHDLKDLEELLEQTQGTGVYVYTHGEMLPANSYPFFKKYPNFVGNYGGSWWHQKEEFSTFNGPILFTTNCIVPPKADANYIGKIFTTGSAGFPGAIHIAPREQGKQKDFSPVIAMAKQCQPPQEFEKGELIAGFAHHQVLQLADKVIDAVKQGAIKKFVVMAGCDGRMKSRSYYTEFAEALPQDSVILTAGCAKYRYNKLPLGDIGGIPRVLDAGQCNDSYSLVRIALKLKEVFGLEDVNQLPIVC